MIVSALAESKIFRLNFFNRLSAKSLVVASKKKKEKTRFAKGVGVQLTWSKKYVGSILVGLKIVKEKPNLLKNIWWGEMRLI